MCIRDSSNSTQKTGDVLAYIIEGEGGAARCVQVFEMRPGSLRNYNLPCKTNTVGKNETMLHVKWADAVQLEGLRKLALRKKVDWD